MSLPHSFKRELRVRRSSLSPGAWLLAIVVAGIISSELLEAADVRSSQSLSSGIVRLMTSLGIIWICVFLAEVWVRRKDVERTDEESGH